jgi:hypothetical protein
MPASTRWIRRMKNEEGEASQELLVELLREDELPIEP